MERAAPEPDCVHRAGRPFFQREPISSRHVAHVGEVALGAHIAHLQQRRDNARLHLRQFPRKAGNHEVRRLARPDVVERSHPHDVEAVTLPILQGQHVLPDLAHRVRVGGTERRRFVYGQVFLFHHTVDVARTHREQPRFRYVLLQRQDDVQLAQDIGGEGLGRFAPRGRYMRLGREMKDAIGFYLPQGGVHAGFIGDIRGKKFDAVAEVREIWLRPGRLRQTPHFGPLRQARIRQVAARKAGNAGNEYAHGKRLLKSRERVGFLWRLYAAPIGRGNREIGQIQWALTRYGTLKALLLAANNQAEYFHCHIRPLTQSIVIHRPHTQPYK